MREDFCPLTLLRARRRSNPAPAPLTTCCFHGNNALMLYSPHLFSLPARLRLVGAPLHPISFTQMFPFFFFFFSSLAAALLAQPG